MNIPVSKKLAFRSDICVEVIVKSYSGDKVGKEAQRFELRGSDITFSDDDSIAQAQVYIRETGLSFSLQLSAVHRPPPRTGVVSMNNVPGIPLVLEVDPRGSRYSIFVFYDANRIDEMWLRTRCYGLDEACHGLLLDFSSAPKPKPRQEQAPQGATRAGIFALAQR